MSENSKTAACLNKPVFISSSLVIFALLFYTVWDPASASALFESLQNVVAQNGGWFYILTVAIILITVVILGFSRYGDIRLGPDHATPEFSKMTWLSMLFAAGMGIGLMFFGVAEPIMHFLSPPSEDPQTIAAVKEAMKTTFFHWGVHPWAIYAAVALVLGYFAYRHQLPLTLRSALYPLIGDKIYGWPGHVVDIFAVTSTIFGVSTSLGFGASQINAGLSYIFGIPSTTGVQMGLMAGVVAIAIVSVTTGLDKGIRRLSETNMILAVALLVFILVLGPTVFLLQAYLQNMGAYTSDLVRNTFNLYAYAKTDWIGGWTIFYWGWWLAWAPFVGLFIARISYGRTIREFVIGVLLIPTAFTLLWMTVFGNTAIDMVLNQGKETLASMVNEDTSVALFVFLENFPFSTILTLLAVLMVVIFFVTSCDSGAMVVDMLCSNGRNDTPMWQRIYWTVGVGVVGAILLFAGGLSALQTMTIVAALPFSVILLISLYGLMKALRVEDQKRECLTAGGFHSTPGDSDKNWRSKLSNIVSFPNKKAVRHFMQTSVIAAFEEAKKEFEGLQFEVEITQANKFLVFTVVLNEQPDFIYAVHLTPAVQPHLTESTDPDCEDTYYRAEVHLTEGGQDYNIMGWSTLSVINDVIDQYHKHLHFLHRIV